MTKGQIDYRHNRLNKLKQNETQFVVLKAAVDKPV